MPSGAHVVCRPHARTWVTEFDLLEVHDQNLLVDVSDYSQ
jgi:hypothetical protein